MDAGFLDGMDDLGAKMTNLDRTPQDDELAREIAAEYAPGFIEHAAAKDIAAKLAAYRVSVLEEVCVKADSWLKLNSNHYSKELSVSLQTEIRALSFDPGWLERVKLEAMIEESNFWYDKYGIPPHKRERVIFLTGLLPRRE